MTIANTDLLVVQRNDTVYKTNFETIKDSIIDGFYESQRITIVADFDGQTEFDFFKESFDVDKVQVYLNGTFLDSSVYDIQEDKVVLDTGADRGDILDLIQPIIPEGSTVLPYDRQTFQVASGTQSVFNLTPGITAGFEHVYLNGLLLDSVNDYTLASNTITLDTDAEQDDILEVLQPETIQGDSYYRNKFAVTSSLQTVFQISGYDLTNGTELVWLNGNLLLGYGDYIYVDNGIELNVPAVRGDVLEIISNNIGEPLQLYQQLFYVPYPDYGEVGLTNGSWATIPGATDEYAGLLTADDKYKLDTVEEGAKRYPSWNDVTDKPTIGDGTLTIKDSNGSDIGTFRANQTANNSIQLPTVDYEDLDNKPNSVVEKVVAGAGITVTPNTGVGEVTIDCQIDQLEFGGSADVTSSTVPSTTFNAVPLAIADFYVNVGFGKFSAQWAAVTVNADTNTDADPGDYLVYNGTGFEHIPSGTPPAADPLWIAAGGKLEPVNKANQLLVGNNTANVSLEITGKATSTATTSTDGTTTLTTKGFVDGLVGARLSAVQVTAPITVDNSNSTQPIIGINLSTISNIDTL